MKSLFKAVNMIEKIVLVSIMAFVLVLVFLATVGRYTGLYKIAWSEEAARYLIIWMVYFGFGIAGRDDSHFQVTALTDSCKPKVKVIFYVLQILIVAAFCIFAARYGIDIAMKQAKMNQSSAALKVPMWIPYLAIPYGCISMLIRYPVQRIGLIKEALASENNKEEKKA